MIHINVHAIERRQHRKLAAMSRLLVDDLIANDELKLNCNASLVHVKNGQTVVNDFIRIVRSGSLSGIRAPAIALMTSYFIFSTRSKASVPV